MKTYTKRATSARVSHQESTKTDPIAELRCGRAAFGQAAIRFEAAALGVRSPLHAKHLVTLSRLTQEAARPRGRILRELEREVVHA
jgi:hypothetical protein